MIRRLLLAIAIAAVATGCESTLSGPDPSEPGQVQARQANGGIGANNGS